MQQNGTLRKRRLRVISKVTGLTAIPYETGDDNFTARDLFTTPGNASTSETVNKPFSVSSTSNTRLQFCSSAMLQNRRAANVFKSTKDRLIYLGVGRKLNMKNDISIDMENRDNGSYSEQKAESAETEMYDYVTPDKEGQRKYLLNNRTMRRLQQIISLGIATGSVPWKWNKETCTIEKWGPQSQKIWWFTWVLSTFQNIIIVGYQAKTYLHALSVAETHRSAFQLTSSCIRPVYSVGLKFFLVFYNEPTRQYINALLQFNKLYVAKYVIHFDVMEDRGEWFMNAGILSNFATVFFSVSFYFRLAEKPWYMFSIFSPKPWYWRLPGVLHEFMFTGQNAVVMTLIGWIIVAHSNTLKFWLSETHNQNDSDNTTDELRSPKTAMETYRKIQVLQNLLNNCLSPIGIPFVKILMSMVMIIIGYIIVRSMNHSFVDEFPASLFYPFAMFVAATTAFVIIKMTAEVFDLGCSFIDSWSLTKQKDFRTMLLSCSGLKLWVGRSYFMSITTTITFFKVVFDYITNCLVTFK